jgi:hypothetical protein
MYVKEAFLGMSSIIKRRKEGLIADQMFCEGKKSFSQHKGRSLKSIFLVLVFY